MSKRPLIAVDVDGVLYCWDRTARYMLREKYRREGREVPEGLYEPAQHWYGIKETVEKQDWNWLWEEGVDQGLFRHGDIMSGAIFGMQGLAEFADLMIVTSRPQQAVYDTMSWLTHHLRGHVPLVGIDILSHGQPKSGVHPAPDILIDDGPHNLVDWVENTDAAFVLFDQPWNKDVETGGYAGVTRGYGWKDTVEVVHAALSSHGDGETAWSPRHREVL